MWSQPSIPNIVTLTIKIMKVPNLEALLLFSLFYRSVVGLCNAGRDLLFLYVNEHFRLTLAPKLKSNTTSPTNNYHNI